MNTKTTSILLGIVLAISLINLYGTFNLYAKFSELTGGQGGLAPTQNLPSIDDTEPTVFADVSADDDPVKGDPKAPVTIIEFSDFQCPYCARFFEETLPQIDEQYIKTGKVKLVYRDFPLSFHPNAHPAAQAAECADEQGKFWQYHDKIFANQASLSAANLKQWAKDLALDTTKFNSCLDSGKYKSEVDKDLSEGSAAGVSGTPAFFIDGELIVGAQPFSVFQQAIEAALN